MNILVIVTLAILVLLGLLLALMSVDHYLAGFIKMLASTGFILLAIAAGATHSAYGIAILLGLACSWWGDMFLVSRSTTIFMMGLVAFFLAHVAYCVAFVSFGITLPVVALALAALAVPAFVIVRWLNPHLGDMRIPVYAYMTVITVMVSFAAAATFSGGGPLMVTGAIIFYCSDIFVARDRFIIADKLNQHVGLPMYYIGQILLAWSVIYAH